MKIRPSAARKKIHVDPLIYALYKGEQLVVTGTIAEISDAVNSSVEALYYYLYESYRKKTAKRKKSKSSRMMVCLGFDDEEEADEKFLDTDYIAKMRKQGSCYCSVN